MADSYRLRFAYRKADRLAYLGHLEVLNTIERSIRRSGLPFAVGNGFARRMKVQFSQALPVGAFSDGEYVDVVLREPVPADEALTLLMEATPQALGPFRAAYVERRMPALEAWLNRAQWRVDICGDYIMSSELDRCIADVAGRKQLNFMRGDKPRSIDLTSTLVSWETIQRDDGVVLTLETRSSNLGALRPAVLLEAVFAEKDMCDAQRKSQRVCRTGQWHEENGRLVEPFDESFTWSLT